MGFNVYKYDSFVPFLSYQYQIEINGAHNVKVKEVQLPTITFKDDCRQRYGNSQYHLPTYNFADMTLEITYQEDDNLSIYKELTANIDFDSIPSSNYIIVIKKMDYTMTKTIWCRKFICTLLEVDPISFQRSGSPNLIDIKAKFIVRSWQDLDNKPNDTMYDFSPVYSKSQASDVTQKVVVNGKAYSDYINEVKTEEAKQTEKWEAAEQQWKTAQALAEEKTDTYGYTPPNEDVINGTSKNMQTNKHGQTVNAGLMTGEIDLQVLYNLGKQKGYDMTSMKGVQKFMYENNVFSSGSLAQCTRGTALTHQLLEYGLDVTSGNDRSTNHMYQASCKADNYDIVSGNTGNADRDGTDKVAKNFTKNSKFANDCIVIEKGQKHSSKLEDIGNQYLKNSGDYITYSVKKADGSVSQHIVSLYIDENNNRHYYSDFKQGSVNVYAEDSEISNIEIYNYKGK